MLLHDCPEDRGLSLVELHWQSILPSASGRARLVDERRVQCAEEARADVVGKQPAAPGERGAVTPHLQQTGAGSDFVDVSDPLA
jgi:hypothetical protein